MSGNKNTGREEAGFETLMVELSTRFINLPAQEVDTAIEEAQRRVCEYFNLGISAVFQWASHDPDVFILTHLYRPGGGPEVPNRMAALEYFPWSLRMGQSHEVVAVDSVEGMEDADALRDRASWLHYGVRAVVNVPLSAGDGPTFGVMGFCDIRQERDWSEETVGRLKLVAQVVANALARKRAEEELRFSEQRLALAADSAGAGMWSLNMETYRFWITPPIRAMHGYTPGEDVTFERFFNLVHPEDQAAVQQALDQILETRKEVYVEYRIVLDGETRWLAARGRLRSGTGNGAVNEVMGVTLDVTERIQNEQRLKDALDEVNQLRQQLEAENSYLREQLRRDDGLDAIVGESMPVLEMIAAAGRVAPTDSTVLITGETGTGKEVLAQAIHSLSTRKARTMMKVNCAALPSALIEGELFGREKGAYTGAMTRQGGRFEEADGSTIFLDEIGDLPLELQAKLLRVLEYGQFERLGSNKTIRVDVRIIAATNRDLDVMVREGGFREDLFHRLNIFPIRVPPLRERGSDIPLLVWNFIHHFNGHMGRSISSVPDKTMKRMQAYAWPGNIRELRNLVERGVIISTGKALHVDVPENRGEATASGLDTLHEMERRHILAVLDKTKWRIRGSGGAAEVLDMVPTTLHSRMKKLGIRRGA